MRLVRPHAGECADQAIEILRFEFDLDGSALTQRANDRQNGVAQFFARAVDHR